MKISNIRVLLAFVLSGFTSFAHALSCDVADFQVYVPYAPGYQYADDCTSGVNKNTEIDGIIENWLFDDWVLSGKFENNEGTESGSLTASTTASIDGSYLWSFNEYELTNFEDAVFVVKQASTNADESWAAYFFDDLGYSSGEFFLDSDFIGDDYSHLRMYTRGSLHSVPELDAASGSLALAMLISLLALFRERKKSLSAFS